MTITLNGTSGIVNDATSLSYTGTLTGGTGVVNLGSGQVYKDASGNVGIGTSSPAVKLDVVNGSIRVNEDGAGTKVITVRSNWAGVDPAINVTTNNSLLLMTNNTERARIDSSGNLLVGTTSNPNAGKVGITFNGSVANGLVIQTQRTPAGSVFALFSNSANGTAGQISQTDTTTVAYTTSSDYRLKEAVQPMTGALAKVAALKPVTYKWKSNGSDSQGFIAHELQEVVPDCVVGEKDATTLRQVEVSAAVPATFDADGNELTPAVEAVFEEREVPQYQGIDTSFLVATLTAAIQEQQTLITALTARITALEAPIV